MAARSTSIREQLAASALFGFDTGGWTDQAGSGRRTISRRGGKGPPMIEGSLIDESQILDALNETDTAAADQVETDDREEAANA